MEYPAESESSDTVQNIYLYEAIKKAVIQLNLWLTSIESSIKEGLTTPKEERFSKFKELHKKMKMHQDCLVRIVRICQNSSLRTKTSEMNMINEYIMFVSERFEKLRECVEVALKLNEMEIVDKQCRNICEKIKLYKNIILSNVRHSNTNNINESDTIKKQFQKIKLILTRHKKEVEGIHETLSIINEKEFDEFNVEIESIFKSLRIIEESLEKQWRSATEIFQPYTVQEGAEIVDLNELLEDVTTMSESLDINFESFMEVEESLSIVKSVFEAVKFTTESTFYRGEKYSISKQLSTESLHLMVHDSETEEQSSRLTVKPLNIYNQSCNIHYLLREIPIYNLATFQSPEASHISQYFHFFSFRSIGIIPQRIKFICYKSLRRNKPPLQIDSLFSLRNTEYSTTGYKCAPHADFLRLLDTTLTIIKTRNIDTDERLYQQMILFERLQMNRFERNYVMLGDFNSAETKPYIQNINYEKSLKNCCCPPSNLNVHDQQIESSIITFFNTVFSINLLSEFSTSRKYPRARERMSRPILNFIKNHLKFDIGLGSLLLVKRFLFYMMNTFQFDQWVRSMGEVNRYRLISATV